MTRVPLLIVLLDVLAFRKENIYILSDEEGFDGPTYDNIVSQSTTIT